MCACLCVCVCVELNRTRVSLGHFPGLSPKDVHVTIGPDRTRRVDHERKSSVKTQLGPEHMPAAVSQYDMNDKH